MKAQSEHQRIAVDLTNLINTANAPIFGINNEGLVNEWNEKTAQITGYTKLEVLGQQLTNYIPHESKRTVQDVLNNALNGISTSNFECRLITKKGGHLDILLNATPRREELERVYGVVGVGQDITERKRAEIELQEAAEHLKRLNRDLEDKNAALRAANKMKDEFLANTTHELKTPLNGIVGLADSLLATSPGLSSRKLECIRTIKMSGIRLAALVDDILDLSKLKSNYPTEQLTVRTIDLRSEGHNYIGHNYIGHN